VALQKLILLLAKLTGRSVEQVLPEVWAMFLHHHLYLIFLIVKNAKNSGRRNTEKFKTSFTLILKSKYQKNHIKWCIIHLFFYGDELPIEKLKGERKSRQTSSGASNCFRRIEL